MKCIDCGAESGDSARCKSCWDDRHGEKMNAKKEQQGFPPRIEALFTVVGNDFVGATLAKMNCTHSYGMIEEYLSVAEHTALMAEKDKEIQKIRAALEDVSTYSNDPHVVEITREALKEGEK